MAIQAYSREGDHRALTFREQSVEIASLPEGTEFYLTDAQESSLAVTTKTATVQSRTALHPFGHVRFQSGKQSDPWGFVGNEEDRGSGISDFHARPYRPELGAFLAVDPVALLSPEQTIGTPARVFAHAYAGGDPITQADASGLTFGQFVQGLWDQSVENVKATAKATVASAGISSHGSRPKVGSSRAQAGASRSWWGANAHLLRVMAPESALRVADTPAVRSWRAQ